MGFEDVRKRAGGVFIKGTLNSAMRLMRLHPKSRQLLSKVSVERDIRYSDGEEPAHALDVYRPKDHDGPLPVLFYIHGGGFRILSKDTHWMMNAMFALHGFTVFISLDDERNVRPPWVHCVQRKLPPRSTVRLSGCAPGCFPRSRVGEGARS